MGRNGGGCKAVGLSGGVKGAPDQELWASAGMAEGVDCVPDQGGDFVPDLWTASP